MQFDWVHQILTMGVWLWLTNWFLVYRWTWQSSSNELLGWVLMLSKLLPQQEHHACKPWWQNAALRKSLSTCRILCSLIFWTWTPAAFLRSIIGWVLAFFVKKDAKPGHQWNFSIEHFKQRRSHRYLVLGLSLGPGLHYCFWWMLNYAKKSGLNN